LPLRDKSQSVRARCNKAPRSLPIKNRDFLRWDKQADSRCFPREHSWCFQCNLVLSKGALKVLPTIAVAVPSKGALKVLPKITIGNVFQAGGRNRRGALEVLPNANEF